ncbi:MAG TPA: ComEC family competence protein [Sporolactobacillaceae bacterium]|nr:ComEC family competence protein [Sporolactobacillaceae bacterium]
MSSRPESFFSIVPTGVFVCVILSGVCGVEGTRLPAARTSITLGRSRRVLFFPTVWRIPPVKAHNHLVNTERTLRIDARGGSVDIAAGALSARRVTLGPPEYDQLEPRNFSSPTHALHARHAAAPIYAVALAIVAGDALGNFHFVISSWIAVSVGLVAFSAMLRGRTALGLAAAYLAIAIAAAACVADVLNPPLRPDSIATLIDGSPVTIEGHLVRETEREPYGERLYVAVTRAAKKGEPARPMRGLVRIAVLGGGDFRLGDEIRLSARIHFPHNYGNPREFDYAAQMAREGIDATITSPKNSATLKKSLATPALQVIGHHSRFPASEIESIRTHIGAFFDRNLTYPENAEMRALVIGDRGEIREPLRQTFARTGMAHLLVISGLHLSIVAAAVFGFVRAVMMLFRGLANRGYANKIAALAAMLAVCSYASIAGHHVSTVRALVMVLAYMLAVTIDRSSEAIASLALAAIVICVALPGSTPTSDFNSRSRR